VHVPVRDGSRHVPQPGPARADDEDAQAGLQAKTGKTSASRERGL
jgi:hypothetical protein